MIIVKGVKAPKSCRSCFLGGDAYEFCPITGNFNTGHSRPHDCPLVDVEYLIDGKRLYERAAEVEKEGFDKLKKTKRDSLEYVAINAALNETTAWKHEIQSAMERGV